MRAVEVTRFGGPDVLRLADVERPSPISTEILVRVVAAGVNPVDCKTRRGEGVSRWVGPPPFIPGWDVAGVVEAVGYGVTRFEVGDAVYGMPKFPRAAGGYSELVAGPSRQFARAPSKASSTDAAALPLAALTGWQCLVDAAQVTSGQKVLVHGASGGVGHLAVQIARAHGAGVLSTNSRDRQALGASDLDVALDLVGRDDTMLLLDTLREGGLLLAVADGASEEVKREAKQRRLRVLEPLVEPDGHALEKIAELVDSGDLAVTIDKVFPLEEAAAAHERLEKGGVIGKIVLEVDRR
ncbi:MAG TPA: NADP-dependent oxidoreductase [Candidatus Acidoferrum sp.]|nr:NADP-dependent oxidoreductase [Candidatus Acidoferrum sp.]